MNSWVLVMGRGQTRGLTHDLGEIWCSWWLFFFFDLVWCMVECLFCVKVVFGWYCEHKVVFGLICVHKRVFGLCQPHHKGVFGSTSWRLDQGVKSRVMSWLLCVMLIISCPKMCLWRNLVKWNYENGKCRNIHFSEKWWKMVKVVNG